MRNSWFGYGKLKKAGNGCRKHNFNSGFTLVEVIVSLGIITLILGSLFNVLISQNRIFNLSMAKWDLSNDARKAMNLLVKEARMSDALYVQIYDLPMDQAGNKASSGVSVEFQVPVDWDADGDFVDQYNQTEWGADGHFDWSIEYYRDSASNELKRRVWDSAGAMDSQTTISTNITAFQVNGYRYSGSLKKYVLDIDLEIIEVSISATKSLLRGITLNVPLAVSLKNRINFRN